MSDFSTVVDAIVSELTATVPALAAAKIHRYTPWDPEELVADRSKHLAVWPEGETTEEAAPMTYGSRQVRQGYVVLCWEPSGAESARGKRDEAAALVWLDLQNAVRARFHVKANMTLGGSMMLRYISTRLPERSGQVRWFELRLIADRELLTT